MSEKWYNNKIYIDKKNKDIEQGLKFEEQFKKYIKGKWMFIYQQNKFQEIDYMIVNPYEKDINSISYVELKMRNITKKTFEETFIPLRKYKKAIELIESWYKVFLIIKWIDFIWYIDFQKVMPYKIDYITSRRDRWKDEKWFYVYFNVNDFKKYNMDII